MKNRALQLDVVAMKTGRNNDVDCPSVVSIMARPNHNWRDSDMVDGWPLAAAEFQYRNNGDGTWDSICLRCFLTVGTARTIEELVDMEKAHNCYTKKRPKGDRSKVDRE